MYEAAEDAVGRARAGNGPTLMEVQVHRRMGHFMGDPETYRPDEEVDRFDALDPIDRLEETLAADGVDAERIDDLREEAEARVFDARSVLKAGDEIEAKFIGLDRKSRTVNLSIKAREDDEERAAVGEYQRGEAGGKPTLGDLLTEQIGADNNE
jgi:TPP-dependent pyruvate/acetoin dehydrogenase alpha subunit